MITIDCRSVIQSIFFMMLSISLYSPVVMASQFSQDLMEPTRAGDAVTGNQSASIPLIDRAVPSAYETATFGLG